MHEESHKVTLNEKFTRSLQHKGPANAKLVRNYHKHAIAAACVRGESNTPIMREGILSNEINNSTQHSRNTKLQITNGIVEQQSRWPTRT